jgi:hypothetical protein
MAEIDRNNMSQALAAKMGAIYEDAEYEIYKKVAKRMARGVTEPGWAEHKYTDIQALRADLTVILSKLQREGKEEMLKAAEAAYLAGDDEGAADLVAHLSPDAQLTVRMRREAYSTNTRGTRAIARAMAEPGAQAFADSHTTILRSVEDSYFKIIARAAALQTTGAITRREATQRAVYAFADEGIASFIDKRGRKWGMAEYAEMATRTAVIRSYVQGKVDRFKADGRDLVIVSNSPEECNLCRPWEGKILSLSGTSYTTPATSSRVLPPPPPPPPDPPPEAAPVKPKKPKKEKPVKEKPPEPDPREVYRRAAYDHDSFSGEFDDLDQRMYQQRKDFYDRRGYYPKPGDDYYYDGMTARRDELEKLIVKAKKDMEKALKKVMPYGYDLEKFKLMSDQEKHDHLERLIVGASRDEQQALDYLDNVRATNREDKWAMRTARTELQLASAAAQNTRKLLTESRERIKVARLPEERPEPTSAYAKAVRKLIDKGIYDQEGIRAVGKLIREEVESRWESVADLTDGLGGLGRNEYQRAIMRNRVKDALDEIRYMGTIDHDGNEARHEWDDDSDERTKEKLRDQIEKFPNSWVKRSAGYNRILTKLVDRGYQLSGTKGPLGRPTKIMLSGTDGEYADGVAIHEWSHRMEETHGRLVELERQYYASRTKGEKLRKLSAITGNDSFDDEEVSREDKFNSPYMGKDYGGVAYELLSMGMEQVFFYRATGLGWKKDPDYIDFILGMLAAG